MFDKTTVGWCCCRSRHRLKRSRLAAQLTRADVRIVCDVLNVGSMNLGVGENGLHSEYRNILEVSATGRAACSSSKEFFDQRVDLVGNLGGRGAPPRRASRKREPGAVKAFEEP